MIDEPRRQELEYRPASPPLLTADQLAAWLQVSVRSLWRMRSAGDVPAPVRIRGAVRWRAADIEGWLAAGCPSVAEQRPEKRPPR